MHIIIHQNLLFGLFSIFHERVVADAKQAGTHDEGTARSLMIRAHPPYD